MIFFIAEEDISVANQGGNSAERGSSLWLERGCVEDQPQHLQNFHLLRPVSRAAADLRHSCAPQMKIDARLAPVRGNQSAEIKMPEHR
jgi:hypothetical protein